MDPKRPQLQHLLRSRSRSFGSPSVSQQTAVSGHDKSMSFPSENRNRQSLSSLRKPSIYKFFLLGFILLTIVLTLLRSGKAKIPRTIPPAHGRHELEIEALVPLPSRPTGSGSTSLSNSSKVPFVDRSILQRLADMEIFPDPDERPYFAQSPHRPPMVTRIPEARRPLGPPLPPDICGASPCRFLLPLRIGEQESKARIHFMEILQLAQKLDRILVLPNVGKSRIGACFKSDFETYYDLERLTHDLALPTGQAATMKLDLFWRWVDAEAPSAQLGFLSAKQRPQSGEELSTFSNEDLSVRVGSVEDKMDLPPCFTKFHALHLGAHAPLYIHLKRHARAQPIDASIVDALTRPNLQASTADSPLSPTTDPAVLVLSWDLRTAIFPATPARRVLQYAPRLHALAAALAPPAPYVMVHWRMETVAPTKLPDCAHALVDTLVRLPGGVRTVWFASDYPHAVHRSARPGVDFGAAAGSAALKAKSGTFRDVGPLHAVAVGIFGDAFAEGGELEGWDVAELTDGRLAALEGEWEEELLDDAGVRGIVDKIIGMRAALFVSGAPGCARSSSFTRQVLDERRAALDKLSDGVQNIVELFG